MGEKDKLIEEKIKYEGLFNFKDVYNFLYTYLIDNEYMVEEKVYTEKVKGGDAKEIEIAWLAKRKITDYFRFILKVDWRILGMKTVEVMKDGKKVKMNSGLLEIKFVGFLERDYDNKWEGSALFRFFRGVYDQFVIKSTIKGYEQILIGELLEGVNQLKSFLVIEGKH